MHFLHRKEGYTLIVVLWALVILSVIFINLVDEVSINGLLVYHNLEEKKIYQNTVSGIMQGINLLKNDKGDFDIEGEEFKKPIEFEVDGINYQVKIKDIGNKLNINYAPFTILSSYDWWNENLKNKLVQEELIPAISLFEKKIDANEKIKNKFTVYGEFNINTDRLGSLEKILAGLEVSNYEIDMIINFLKKQRQENKFITVNDLQDLYLKGLSSSTLQRLKPHITSTGRININLVDEDILSIIVNRAIKDSKKSEIITQKLLGFKKNNTVKEFAQLKKIINDEKSWQVIKNYFTTQSHFFLIEAKAFSVDSKELKQINCDVKRYKEDNGDLKVKILRWNESR